jgi:hypothetical protein
MPSGVKDAALAVPEARHASASAIESARIHCMIGLPSIRHRHGLHEIDSDR